MLIEKFGSGLFGFHGSKFVSLCFEAGDDVSNDASLDSVGFNLLTRKVATRMRKLTPSVEWYTNNHHVNLQRTMM